VKLFANKFTSIIFKDTLFTILFAIKMLGMTVTITVVYYHKCAILFSFKVMYSNSQGLYASREAALYEAASYVF